VLELEYESVVRDNMNDQVLISQPNKYEKKHPHRNQGQVLIEYGMISSMIILVVVMSLRAFGVELELIFRSLICELSGSDSCDNLFRDDFDDLNLWTIVRGKWDIEDGKVCGGPGKGRIFTEIDEGNYVITVDGANLSKGKGFGVYFRTNNPEKVDGYNFQFDPGYKKGSFIFRKWVKGRQLKPFAINTAPDFDWYDKDYTMQIFIEGNTFTVFINDEQVLQGTDDTYQEGGIGLRTWNKTEVCIEGISVDRLP
jgi:fructan beta-fructosidase